MATHERFGGVVREFQDELNSSPEYPFSVRVAGASGRLLVANLANQFRGQDRIVIAANNDDPGDQAFLVYCATVVPVKGDVILLSMDRTPAGGAKRSAFAAGLFGRVSRRVNEYCPVGESPFFVRSAMSFDPDNIAATRFLGQELDLLDLGRHV